MKKIGLLLALFPAFAFLAGCSDDYDDSELWKEVNDQAARIAALEKWQETVNGNISSLQGLVTALQNNDYVMGVVPFETPAPGGTRVTFSKSGEVTIWNGAKGETGASGADGKDGKNAPAIGVAEFPSGSGVYYWTLGGEFIEQGDQKLPVTGEAGEAGQKGATPKLAICPDNFWHISPDGKASGTPPGAGWTNTNVKATGNDGAAGSDGPKGDPGDAIFAEDGVTEYDNYVEFELTGGNKFKLPRYNMVFTVDIPDAVYLKFETSQSFDITGKQNIARVVITKPDGWRTAINSGLSQLTITAPDAANTYAEMEGVVSVMAFNSAGLAVTMAVNVYAGNYVSPSNSYMVAPGSEAILIPVSQANRVLTEGSGAIIDGLGGVTVDNFTVELVWADTQIESGGVIEELRAESYGEGYVYVKPGIAGNAVVCVKVDGEIQWSWHIWVTEPVGEGTDQVTGLTWMDRNLGSAGVTYNSGGKNGLFYQWGRKDPFPGSNGTTAIQQYYTHSGGPTNANPKAAYSSLPELVRNPLTFATYDYYTGSAGNESWNAEAKTLYDPCPDGWVMPPIETSGTNNWGAANDWKSQTNNGRIFNGATGSALLNHFYPAAGYRNQSGTGLNSVGGSYPYGYYWAATADESPSGKSMYFGSSAVYPNYSSSRSRANGYTVRCVKE